MAKDFQRIKERFNDARDAMSEQRSRMVEDMEFSNPADPKQWDSIILKARGRSMPSYTFDQTNQYLSQVVNDGRMNKPQIQTVPADSGADEKVSNVLDGMIRQIEYASTASIAYDTALESAARSGRGWLRLVTEVVDPKYNLQELRIRPVIDCLSVIPGDYTLPDGSDMTFGFVETRVHKSLAQKYGISKRRVASWDADGNWFFDDDTFRIAEYYEVVESQKGRVLIDSEDGDLALDAEDIPKLGYEPKIKGEYQARSKTVRWCKLYGDDFIEDETTFPGEFIPLFPVHGYEIWIEGKRFLCGMVRRMMDSQRAYNIDRSSEILLKAMQPKSPYLVAAGAIEGLENKWKNANASNDAYLPYNHLDENGQPFPVPQRIAAPQISPAYIQGSQQALADLQASVGMYRANLGAPSNETSGIAIKRREQQGDTANFHFIDNTARTMGHLGRVIVGAIPIVYADSKYGKRDVRTLGIDGTSGTVTIDPDQSKAHKKNKEGDVTINPTTGKYDVRVKVGPAYANLREELSQRLTEISQGNPQLGAALAPLLTQMMDMPEAEKVSKICLALLPPQVQQAYNTDGKQPEIPPEVMAQMQQMQAQLQQAHQALIAASQHAEQLEQQQQMRTAQTQMELQAKVQMAREAQQATDQREMVKLQAANQREQLKQQAENQREADKHQRTIDHYQITSQTELAGKQHDASIEMDQAQTNAQLQITLQAMRDAAAKQSADIASMTQLLLKMMEPPPDVTQTAEAPAN